MPTNAGNNLETWILCSERKIKKKTEIEIEPVT
jgi:hypothetical protein